MPLDYSRIVGAPFQNNRGRIKIFYEIC